MPYAEANPGHHRLLFGSAGIPQHESPTLASMRALRLLDDALRVYQPELSADQAPSHATICLWALHGLVMLRRSRPSFPWPDLDEMIDCLITAHGHP
jgi:Tetracyclin repressor-like, C-terminal domain